jgi:hypothetical protein
VTRFLFRWCRIWVWFLLLLVVAVAVYFNMIGLPEFLKKPLLAELQERGWNVEFSNMRWHWYRGLIIDDAQFTPTRDESAPQANVKFSAKEADLNFNFSEWRKGELKLDGFIIRDGQLALPEKDDRPELILKEIQTRFRFRSDGRVEVKPLEAVFRGAKIKITAVLTNAAALGNLTWFQERAQTNQTDRGKSEKFWDLLDEFKFAATPELQISFHGDAADLYQSRADLKLVAAGAQTPWGTFGPLAIDAELNKLADASSPHTKVSLRTETAATPWLNGTNLQLHAEFFAPNTNLHDWNLQFEFSGNNLRSDNSSTTNSLEWNTGDARGRGKATFQNAKLQSADARLRLKTGGFAFQQPDSTNTMAASLKQGNLTIAFDATSTNQNPELNGTILEKLQPLEFAFDGVLQRIMAPPLNVAEFDCSLAWKTNELSLSRFAAVLYGGKSKGTATVNVLSRKAEIDATADFDIHKISPLLTDSGRKFLSNYTWETPPKIEAKVSAMLPAWTNREPDWQAEVLPTLQIDGRIAAGPVTYRKVEALSASAEFHFLNMAWRLPEIHITRPEGEARLGLLSDERTRAYCWRIDSSISPQAVRHLFDEEQQGILDKLEFSTPPRITGEICGLWNQPETVEFRGAVAVTNCSYRHLDLNAFRSSIQYSNAVLSCTNIEMERGGWRIDSPKIEIFFSTNRIYFTDVKSTFDPHLVVSVIGKDAIDAIAPYHFGTPPRVVLNGALTIGKVDDAEMRFVVAGDDFSWEWMRADEVAANVIWLGKTLLVTNASASVYGGGKLTGAAYFEFPPKREADYRFDVAFSEIDVQTFAQSIGRTNGIEGKLTGELNIHEATTAGLETWHGRTQLDLHDGLIWQIPLFGIFSPILDAVVPGLGKSRAREATGSFSITNGVAVSDNFEIRASAFRMQYKGSVDYQQRVDARVMAEVFRDTWGIGKVVSLALMPLSKLFEYRVAGTLDEPVTEPVYIPKFLLKTMRPFNTMKKVFSDKTEESAEPGE